MDKILAITEPLALPIVILNFINNGGCFFATLLAVIAGAAIYYPVKVIINIIKNRDIKKLNYFLDHKKELNENIEKSENRPPFNINNIDNYSLSDLRTLRENLERISSFEFKETESIPEDTIVKKTLSKKRK